VRSGAPDWERICGVDPDGAVASGRAWRALDALVDTITFSKLSATELRRAGFDASARLARLLQLTVEYLLYVQHSLLAEKNAAAEAFAKSQARVRDLEDKLRTAEAQRDVANDHCRHYRAIAYGKTLMSSSELTTTPSPDLVLEECESHHIRR